MHWWGNINAMTKMFDWVTTHELVDYTVEKCSYRWCIWTISVLKFCDVK